jgi:hypothetical protein
VRNASRVLIALLVAGCWLMLAPLAAAAAGAPTLGGVIDSLRLWVVGLLAGLATLFLTIGGVRYITAGGDPVQVERAKTALRSAAIGYALAALSPVIVAVRPVSRHEWAKTHRQANGSGRLGAPRVRRARIGAHHRARQHDARRGD